MPIVKIVYKSYNIKRKRKVFLGRSNADIFSEIYDRKLWGKKPENVSDFYSGTGSCGKPVEDYVNCINTFILDNKISSITDVGCGDFFVGGKIISCKFPYVIITEHQYKKGLEKSFNKDKPSGPDIRLVEFSGVYLDKEPFNLEATEILRCREDSNGREAHIVSYLIIN